MKHTFHRASVWGCKRTYYAHLRCCAPTNETPRALSSFDLKRSDQMTTTRATLFNETDMKEGRRHELAPPVLNSTGEVVVRTRASSIAVRTLRRSIRVQIRFHQQSCQLGSLCRVLQLPQDRLRAPAVRPCSPRCYRGSGSSWLRSATPGSEPDLDAQLVEDLAETEK